MGVASFLFIFAAPVDGLVGVASLLYATPVVGLVGVLSLLYGVYYGFISILDLAVFNDGLDAFIYNLDFGTGVYFAYVEAFNPALVPGLLTPVPLVTPFVPIDLWASSNLVILFYNSSNLL